VASYRIFTVQVHRFHTLLRGVRAAGPWVAPQRIAPELVCYKVKGPTGASALEARDLHILLRRVTRPAGNLPTEAPPSIRRKSCGSSEPGHHGRVAFRIHDSVVRGEIDNRVKGTVRGKIWVEGRADPIVVELQGNAWPDLAGYLLTFANRLTPVQDPRLDSLAPLQLGTIGDLTASRKVRVFDVPLREAFAMIDRKEKPPEHMANSLYLEWFSKANGRVVIESADYQLTVSAPEWRMTPEDDAERAKQAAAGLAAFVGRLTEAIERHQHGQKAPDAEWDEQDYEKFLKESDARTDKYMELLDKYGDSEEAEARIAQAMGWDCGNDENLDERMSIDEANALCEAAASDPPPEPDPHREGIDWIRTESGALCHPLQHRCFELAISWRRQIGQLGLAKSPDKDLERFIFEFRTTGAKLAGALNSFARGATCSDAAFTVACLKRALDHLHMSQAGLEALALKKLLPDTMIPEIRKELFAIREDILRLMDEFRGRSRS
jgi:hypothetical protein